MADITSKGITIARAKEMKGAASKLQDLFWKIRKGCMTAEPLDTEMSNTFKLTATLRPSVATTAYRDAMASMGATACLVTAQLGSERVGRTVTSTFSLSIEPPTLLVSIDLASRLAAIMTRTRGFSFAILADTQQEIADAFAGRGDPQRRFDNGNWLAWKSGHPRLADAVVSMDCEIIGAVGTGSHVLFAGAVVDVHTHSSRAPLIWHQRQYKSVSNRPTPPVNYSSGSAEDGERSMERFGVEE